MYVHITFVIHSHIFILKILEKKTTNCFIIFIWYLRRYCHYCQSVVFPKGNTLNDSFLLARRNILIQRQAPHAVKKRKIKKKTQFNTQFGDFVINWKWKALKVNNNKYVHKRLREC